MEIPPDQQREPDASAGPAPAHRKRVQYRLELQNAAGVTFSSCESRPIDVSGWAGEPSQQPQQQQTLMIVLAAAAVILLAALVAALAGAF